MRDRSVMRVCCNASQQTPTHLAVPARSAPGPTHLAALGLQLSRGRAGGQVALAQRGVELAHTRGEEAGRG